MVLTIRPHILWMQIIKTDHLDNMDPLDHLDNHKHLDHLEHVDHLENLDNLSHLSNPLAYFMSEYVSLKGGIAHLY